MTKGQEIVLYQRNKDRALEVQLLNDTLWMPQKDIAILFGTQRPAITKHLANIFKSGELDKNSVCSILELTADDGKRYKTKFYNLDAIISIGYRVNSIQATQFRIWATKVLREKILKIKDNTEDEKEDELSKLIDFISNITSGAEISGDEAKGLLRVIVDYKYALETLDKYDNRSLQVTGVSQKTYLKISYREAMKSIEMLRKKFESSSLFGREKDDSFKSSLSTIYQTFDGKELYPSIEEKAAHLLYFIIKGGF
ncbi:cytochrome C biogenesis protein CycH [Bacteroidetes/Chlorobi group bacterium ChocPot_Mid]|nr:MAG: cytochrome C biogenesis protein CycH [Bacteroidetes/Chlorobi group bacterium ChocPot_Mid]